MVGFDVGPIPKTKASSLLNEAVDVFRDISKTVDVSVRGRLKREAEALTKTDGAAEAWQVLGMIAAYERDVKLLPIFFKNAMNLSSGFSVVSNFATAWQHVYEFDKGIEILESFRKKHPYHIDCLRSMANMASTAGMYDKEIEILTVLEKLVPEDYEISEDIQVAEVCQSIAHEHNMTDASSEKAISFVMKFVRDKGFNIVRRRAAVLQDEFDTWIAYYIRVDTEDFDQIVRLNLDLCDAKASLENGHLLFNNGLSISIEGSQV